MIDGGLRPIFRERLRAGFHWQSIETGDIAQGVPDSNYCSEGREGWIEFKLTTTKRVPLAIAQVAWLEQRARRGGRVRIGVRQKHGGGPRKGPPVDRLWILCGSSASLAAEAGLVRSAPYVLGVWEGGPAGWNWPAVREILLR